MDFSERLEKPRQIILSEHLRTSVMSTKPQKRLSFKESSLRKYTKQQIKLPTIFNHDSRRRVQTEVQQEFSLDRSKMSLLNQLRTSLKRDKKSILLNELSTKIKDLQNLHVVSGGLVRNVRYSGHIRIPTVHNDYHNSKTNAGYSRNKYGGIYPK